MVSIRRAGWFVLVALMMAGWTGVLGSIRGEAIAGVIASRGTDAGDGLASRAAQRSVSPPNHATSVPSAGRSGPRGNGETSRSFSTP